MNMKRVLYRNVLVSIMVSLSACNSATTDQAKRVDTPAAKVAENIDTSAHINIASINAENPFFTTSDVMRDVNANLSRARDGNKLSLLVVGANWCHDSLGLAHKFQDEEMVKILNAGYEVSFIDAGFLTEGFDVAQRFGLPIYFATPTVFIIDPTTEKLVNANNMDQWKNADSIAVEDYRTYFANYATAEGQEEPQKVVLTHSQKATLEPLMMEIKAFEDHQAKRIRSGYQHVGPMLAMDPRPDDMMGYWVQVRKVRYNLPSDMAALRKSATKQVLAGETNIMLEFPDYGKYSWE